ncbi:hypothetical protein HDE_05876 [Halotydeus destructor]|nr:hypothetical protein HDE_05876 [Halotydeus destructor]
MDMMPTAAKCNSRSRLYRTTENVILAICLVAGVWQTGTVIERYFSYPVKVKTVLTIPKIIELPAVSLCIAYRSIRSRIKTQIPGVWNRKIVVNGEDPETTHWTKYLTIKQYNDVSATRTELIDKCTLFAPNMTQLSCQTWDESPVHLHYSWKCFTLFDDNEQKYRNITSKYRMEDLFNIPWIEVKMNTANFSTFLNNAKLAVSIHPNEEHVAPDMGSRTFYEFDFSLHSAISLTYTRATNRLLPSPYPSNCMNYFNRYGNPVPRKKVIEGCAVERFVSETGYWPRDILAEKELPFFEDTLFSSNEMKMYSFEERYECNNDYPRPDCESLNYLVDVKALMASSLENRCEVTIYGPSDNEMVVEQEASFDIIDLFSYGGGVFGLWIGFSILNIAKFCIQFLSNVQRQIYLKTESRRYWKQYNRLLTANGRMPFRHLPPMN